MARTALVVPFFLAALAAEASDVVDDRLALNYEIVFDTSGSMGERDKIGGAKRALKKFLGLVPQEARVGLIVFTGDGRPRRILELGNLDRQQVASLVDPLVPDGNTPIKDSVLLASASLLGQREKQQGYGAYTIVVVTDGEETVDPRGITAGLQQVLASGIAIEVIGFDVPDTYSLRNQVTKYRAANNEAELAAALSSVLGEAETYDEAAQFAHLAATTPEPPGPSSTGPAAPPQPATANSTGGGGSPILTLVGVFVVVLVVVVALTRSRGART